MRHETEPTAPRAVDRRLLLKATAAGLVTSGIAAPAARAQEEQGRVRAESFAQTHQPKPLPFNSVAGTGCRQRLDRLALVEQTTAGPCVR